MQSKWHEAVSSINAYVKELAKKNANAEVTLATFDSMPDLKFEVIRNGVKAKDWVDFDVLEAAPRGFTPLYDAIGNMARRALDADRARSVIVIMTDGHENASRELNRVGATGLLDKCRDKGWQTIFLGADFDAAPQATSLGNAMASTINVSPQSLRGSMTTLAGYSSNYAATGAAMAFTDEDRKRAVGTTS